MDSATKSNTVCEHIKSELDLFSVPSTRRKWYLARISFSDHRGLDNGSPIEFDISRISDNFDVLTLGCKLTSFYH